MSARQIFIVAAIVCLVTPSYADDWSSEAGAAEIAQRAKTFEAKLHNIGFMAEVVSCSHVVREAEGRAGDSWGAVCSLKTSRKEFKAQICDDDAVGYFAFQSGTFAISDADTAEFMEHNCRGG